MNRLPRPRVAPGKGGLAADESSGTIKKRFDSINVESTADSRRDYREMLFRTEEAMKKYISGVILYDETIRQKAKEGTPLVDLIRKAGSIPGIIKVDTGARDMLRLSPARRSPRAWTVSANASRSTTTSARASRNGAR